MSEQQGTLRGIWTCVDNRTYSGSAMAVCREQLASTGDGHEDGAEIYIDGARWQWRTLPLVRYPSMWVETIPGNPVKTTRGVSPWLFALFVVGPLAFLAGLVVGLAR